MTMPFLERPVVQAGLALAVLLVLIAFAFWLLARFRDYAAQDRHDPQEVLANLQEMHLRGDITAEEFRTIKASTAKTSRDATPPSIPDASPTSTPKQSATESDDVKSA